MGKLPKKWRVNIFNINQQEDLFKKFKTWINNRDKGYTYCLNLRFYGCDNYVKNAVGELYTDEKVITLEEWHNAIFGEEFIQGEKVLVRDNCSGKMIDAIFIAKYNDRYIVAINGGIYPMDECKKFNELDIKIEELKRLAEEKGLKITINFE